MNMNKPYLGGIGRPNLGYGLFDKRIDAILIAVKFVRD